jgi:hypothetical protein
MTDDEEQRHRDWMAQQWQSLGWTPNRRPAWDRVEHRSPSPVGLTITVHKATGEGCTMERAAVEILSHLTLAQLQDPNLRVPDITLKPSSRWWDDED